MCSLAKKLSFSSERMEENMKTFNKKSQRRLGFDSLTSTLTATLDNDEESRDSGIGSDDEISRIFNGSPMHCRKRPREEDYEREDISKKIKTVNYEDTNLSSWDSEKIITALNYMDIDKENKIGDFSGPYCLPTTTGKHSDLKSITTHTVKRLINQDFADKVAHYMIIDCRYPYEFKGGHIEGATNLYTRNDITTLLLSTARPHSSTDKRTIIVFHCEFSSQRGPTLARYLRQKDRDINKDMYPALQFPEIYLLDGGYKALYESYPEHCRPKAYVPMMHSEHSTDLKHFRVKSKSWPRERMTISKCLRI